MTKVTPEQLKQLKAEAKATCWQRGYLRYLLHGNQQAVYDLLETGKHRTFFALWSRRCGKSFFGIIRALETAIRIPNARILYLAPHARNAKDIVTDQLPVLLADCPENLKPEINHQAQELRFKNGALIRFKGVNAEKVEDLRGGFAHLVVLDEAGSINRLAYVVGQVVRPMTATTRGSILLLTTPPNHPGHDSQPLYERLKAKGSTYDVTLAQAQNPSFPYEERVEMLLDMGEAEADVPAILAGDILPKTRTAQRECFCQWVVDAGQLVVPEFLDAQADVVRAPPEPPIYRDCYVGADWGSVDPSGALFGYWDTNLNALVVEDEWLERAAGTPALAGAISGREKRLWQGRFDVFRVCDIDLRLQRDLSELHQLRFALADKKDRNANIELLRSYIRRRDIVIHPRCTKLIRQLMNAQHNRSGKDFVRSEPTDNPDLDMGHFDLVAALVYLIRFVHSRRRVDPKPRNHDILANPGKHVPLRHPARHTQVAAQQNLTPFQRRVARRGGR